MCSLIAQAVKALACESWIQIQHQLSLLNHLIDIWANVALYDHFKTTIVFHYDANVFYICINIAMCLIPHYHS